MGINKTFCKTYLIFLIFIYVTTTLCVGHENLSLHVGFYDKSCPDAERIVKKVVEKAELKVPGMAPSLLRLFFHDCFVNGCDASILLDNKTVSAPSEKFSPGNGGVRGFEIIDEAKAELEKACPNTVSCADIVAFAARDSAVITNIAPFDMPAGRQDGRNSSKDNVFHNLPLPSNNVDTMTEIFEKKGMNKSDLVTLLGVHSIGRGHCNFFLSDIHNYDKSELPNPKLNPFYAIILKSKCPNNPKDTKSVLPLNIYEDQHLSAAYYDNLLGGRMIIEADLNLLEDDETNAMVNMYATTLRPKWANAFRDALIKLGNVDVLTGKQGEIRKNCRSIN